MKKKNELELIKRAQSGDLTARDELIAANIRLVYPIARRYKDRGNSFIDDLIQEGCIGLIAAIDRYNPQMGASLSTYATYWIKYSIENYIANNSREIRLPLNAIKELTKINRAATEIAQTFNRTPSFSEIAEKTGLAVSRVIELSIIKQDPISLQTHTTEDDCCVLEEIITDYNEPSIEEAYLKKVYAETVLNLINTLPERTAFVLKCRFYEQMTLESIGKILGLTKERVRQIEASGLRMLRHPNRVKVLKGEI